MTITTSQQLAYDWARCTHEGIGLPGCPTCDPDKHRCLARAEHVRRAAVLRPADRLEAEARALRESVKEAVNARQRRTYRRHLLATAIVAGPTRPPDAESLPDECPWCGNPTESGYGLMAGLGAHAFALTRRATSSPNNRTANERLAHRRAGDCEPPRRPRQGAGRIWAAAKRWTRRTRFAAQFVKAQARCAELRGALTGYPAPAKTRTASRAIAPWSAPSPPTELRPRTVRLAQRLVNGRRLLSGLPIPRAESSRTGWRL